MQGAAGQQAGEACMRKEGRVRGKCIWRYCGACMPMHAQGPASQLVGQGWGVRSPLHPEMIVLKPCVLWTIQ